jgi:Cu2+-exporting ATPase
MLADALAPLVSAHTEALGACAHCGQPVPSPAPTLERQFCCPGCASVFSILHESGLDDYYRQRDEGVVSGKAAVTSGRDYAELDQPEFVEAYCRKLGDGRLGTEFFLENVHCGACVWLVEKITTILLGVTEARLDFSRGILRVAWEPSLVSPSQIARFLDSVGYPCHSLHGLDREAVRQREDRNLLMRIGVAGACAGNAMLLAIALYCGAFSGIERDYAELFRWGSVIVAMPSVLWCANVFYRGALGALRTRTPHMDLPISIGILVGTISGIENTVRSHGEIFFDTITMLVFLLLVGRWLQQRQQRRADGATDYLAALAPGTARVVEGDNIREVPVETVLRGATIEIRAGEHVPVDGTILSGASSVDTSLMTGESMPVEVNVGDTVHAGSINLSSRLLVQARKTGRETRLARLVESVAEAAHRRAPTVILANRLSGYFVTAVLFVAAVTILVLWHRSPTLALGRAVALLVVTCPCALGLATPLAVTAALGKAARIGLVIKGGQYLEALARPGLIVFDKTGTLTEGKLSLVEFFGDDAAKSFVAAAEAGSAHPVARALCVALPPSALAVESMRETLGGGVEAVISGAHVLIGSATFVGPRARPLAQPVRARIADFSARALTPVLVAIDGEVRAVAAIGDAVRVDARESLEKLLALGHRLAVLSGDQPAVVRAVVARIGVRFEEVVGGASPEEKLAFIEERAKKGPVFMVGDGVNDAAALSAATVGIAVHGGAEASLAAADVFATRSGLSPIVDLAEGSRRTLAVIRGNLARSLVYNLTVGGLAATGFVGPLLAAVLMPVSSIGVVTSSFRSRTFGEKT